jgi:PemK-like, MazF-like toxin of type II toxin-antitoxin system
VLGRLASAAVGSGVRSLSRAAAGAPRTGRPNGTAGARMPGRRSPASRSGPIDLEYRPRNDGRPDPGEIVWAWVPYEEGDGRGKDRPVLVVARQGAGLLGLMLSSKDHDLDAADEARHGRSWIDIGSGAWDRQGRPSEVRVDRVLRLDPADVRREGAVLARARFEEVAGEVRRVHGW